MHLLIDWFILFSWVRPGWATCQSGAHPLICPCYRMWGMQWSVVGLHRKTMIPQNNESDLTCLCCPRGLKKKRSWHPHASCGLWALTSSSSMSKPFIIRQQEHSSNSKTYGDHGLKNRTAEWWRFSAALSAQSVCRAAVRLHAAAALCVRETYYCWCYF